MLCREAVDILYNRFVSSRSNVKRIGNLTRMMTMTRNPYSHTPLIDHPMTCRVAFLAAAYDGRYGNLPYKSVLPHHIRRRGDG